MLNLMCGFLEYYCRGRHLRNFHKIFNDKVLTWKGCILNYSMLTSGSLQVSIWKLVLFNFFINGLDEFDGLLIECVNDANLGCLFNM